MQITRFFFNFYKKACSVSSNMTWTQLATQISTFVLNYKYLLGGGAVFSLSNNKRKFRASHAKKITLEALKSVQEGLGGNSKNQDTRRKQIEEGLKKINNKERLNYLEKITNHSQEIPFLRASAKMIISLSKNNEILHHAETEKLFKPEPECEKNFFSDDGKCYPLNPNLNLDQNEKMLQNEIKNVESEIQNTTSRVNFLTNSLKTNTIKQAEIEDEQQLISLAEENMQIIYNKSLLTEALKEKQNYLKSMKLTKERYERKKNELGETQLRKNIDMINQVNSFAKTLVETCTQLGREQQLQNSPRIAPCVFGTLALFVGIGLQFRGQLNLLASLTSRRIQSLYKS